jgi:DNA-directed RNA polymerase subunit M/transcription elongation factor TFIIS
MDLLNVPQVDCLRCQNSINLLIANDQEHGELICERCLELETKKHIHLKLEIQSYERKIKDIKDLSQQEQQRYMKNTDAIIQTHEEENLTQLEYNEMSKELNDVEEQIREEEA